MARTGAAWRIFGGSPEGRKLRWRFAERASSLYRLNDCAAAIPAYEELVARVPEHIWAPESQYQIGICHLRLGQRAAAATAFRRTIDQFASSRWSAPAADRLREIEGASRPGSQ